jgi:hypothetical protein
MISTPHQKSVCVKKKVKTTLIKKSVCRTKKMITTPHQKNVCVK